MISTALTVAFCDGRGSLKVVGESSDAERLPSLLLLVAVVMGWWWC